MGLIDKNYSNEELRIRLLTDYGIDISKDAIKKYISGIRTMPFDKAIAIASILEIDLSKICAIAQKTFIEQFK